MTIRYEDAVAIITINSPTRHNKLDLRMRSAIADAVAAANDQDVTRVLVLSGTSGYFATGSEPYPNDQLAVGAASALAASTKPTIAWINGDCHDMGLELALACDIRMCSANARFAMRQVQQGMLPWDGGTQRLARLVGRGQALRLLLTGEEFDAAEALRIALVQEIGGYAEVMAVAQKIASGAPIAARYAKEATVAGAGISLDQGLRLEADLSVLLQSTDDRSEGLRSFSEKSTPERSNPEFRGK